MAAGKHDILEFRPHDNYLNAVLTRLLNSTYSLNAIGDAAAELPLAWIEMGHEKAHLTRTLIDSGARGNFMSEKFAHPNNFFITPSKIHVRATDNRSVPAAGTTTIPLRLGASSPESTFVVLCDCAYDGILGTKFFYQHAASIDFETRHVRLTVTSGNHKSTVKLHSAGIPLIASQDIQVAPNTVSTIPVIPDPTYLTHHEC
jgi:hypothetical protein